VPFPTSAELNEFARKVTAVEVMKKFGRIRGDRDTTQENINALFGTRGND
jgi:hypothetical protein